MKYEIIELIITSLALGFVIGIQRSLTYTIQNTPFFLGSRSYALISLLGFLSGWLNSKIDGFLLLSSFIISMMISLTYIFKVLKLQKIGITSQIAALLTFLIGVMVWFRLENYAVFITVIILVLLEIKPKLRQLEKNISTRDINAVLLLLVMSFTVLPLLPNEMVGPYHLLNPYKTWVMAIILASLSFIGYIAIKILGQKHGVLITGAAGGLISSTAVSMSLSSIFPKQKTLIKIYSAGIAISWTFMFFRVFIETLLINPTLSKIIAVPYILITIVGLAYVFYLYKNSSITDINFQNKSLKRNPLQLSEALKFALLFGIIYGAIVFTEKKYGDIGVYAISFISGITDVDAITLSISEMAKEDKLSIDSAFIAILTASFTNTLAKLSIVYWFGGKELGWSLTKFTFLIATILFAGIVIEFYI